MKIKIKVLKLGILVKETPEIIVNPDCAEDIDKIFAALNNVWTDTLFFIYEKSLDV